MDREILSGKFQSKTGIIESQPLKQNKITCLYFAALYSRPSISLNFILKDFYNDANQDEKQLEIIYVSLDQTQQEFDQFYDEMSWLAIPYQHPQNRHDLVKLFDVKTIPQIFVLKPSGEIITKNGKSHIICLGVDAVSKWLTDLEEQEEQ